MPEGPIRAEQASELVVVQQVLKDSMRLFPPVPSLSRVATQDTNLGGHRLARGTAVTISVYAVHRHQSVWRNPDMFDPARFAIVNEVYFARCQILPFGAGPRTCSGMVFAMVEATIFLATLARAAHFELIADDLLPTPISRVVLAPRDDMPPKVTLRG
ncbi:MAG: cytochrome P450 [Hyphomicrobiaceae bacterium]